MSVPIPIRIKLLTETAKGLRKSSLDDAAYDIYADESKILRCKTEITKIKTGFATCFPIGYVGLIWDRSGYGSQGIHRVAGVIDPSYRGEWKICLANLTNTIHKVEVGDRIAQVIFHKLPDTIIEYVHELPDSNRGIKGFGSSGR